MYYNRHAFGDVKQCNPETVQLVEELTQQQMTNLVGERGRKRGDGSPLDRRSIEDSRNEERKEFNTG